MPTVFLSHSSIDKPFARRIAEDLITAGINVWLDEWEILIGDSISQKIQSGLKSSDFVIVLLTEHSVSSGWVEKEWQSKIGEEATTNEVKILPLKGDNCEIPVLLKDKMFADFTSDYSSAIELLITSIENHINRLVEKNKSKNRTKTKTSPQNLPNYNNKSVLVLEDNISVLNAMEDILKQFHLNVITATTEESAYALAKRHFPDLCIIDIYWIHNKYYSASLFEKLKSEYPSIKLAGMTGGDPRLLLKEKSHLYDYIICKPIRTTDLIKMLNTLLV